MRNKYILLQIIVLVICLSSTVNSQTLSGQYYNVSPGNGYGLRFWGDDSYKIHMGIGTEYSYGPVTDYAIKQNMNSTAGRGWVWGLIGQTPIAALGNNGNMRIRGQFMAHENVVEHIVSQDWLYASSVWVNRDYTKAFTVNKTSGANLFTVWGNGVVNAKKIYAEEVAIQANAMNIFWPDYVFKPGYNLPKLDEVEAYVATNNHLPDVPSEEEIKRDGIDLGKMNAVLLKKIED